MPRLCNKEYLRAYMIKIGGEKNVYIASDMGQAEREAYRINEDHNPGAMVENIKFLGFIENDDGSNHKE